MRKKYKITRNYVTLGKYLAEKRKEANLTQRQIADKLGYSSPQFISNFERGICAPSIGRMRELTDLLKLKKQDVNEVKRLYVSGYEEELNLNF